MRAHPSTAAAQRTRWLRWRRQIGVVGGLAVGISLLLTASGGGSFFTSLVYSLSIGVACAAIVHATRWAVAAATRRLRPTAAGCADAGAAPALSGWVGVVPGALLALVCGPPLGMWLGDRLTGHRSPSMADLGAAGTRTTLILTVLATLVAVAVLSTLERLHAARAQAEAAQRLAAENQLKLLQSQLEPHMLFNTLANLRVLIGVDAERAQALLDRLIAFLRATLQASRNASQPLAAEFAQLADYLALIKVRMGPRLAVSLQLPPELAALPLPPLLLQPLVENAVKHGVEPRVEGGRIDVAARRDGDTLVLTVRDTGAGLNAGTGTAPPGTSFGLEQVRLRLAALYGGRAALELRPAGDAEGGTLATVRLPCPAATGTSTDALR